MINILTTGAKYLIIVFFAYFVYISFRVQRNVPEERKKIACVLQLIFMLFIHLAGYFVICCRIYDKTVTSLDIRNVIVIYFFQVVYLIFVACLLPLILKLNRGINNVMCMFLAIGFIILARLNFDGMVTQFAIVVISTVVLAVAVLLFKLFKEMLDRLTWIYCFTGLGLLILVFIISNVTNGAKLSISIGSSFSVQPLEFVKILYVLFIAAVFKESGKLKTVLISAVFAGAHVLILVACNDLGSALILAVTYVFMLYTATKKGRYIVISLLLFAAACVAAYMMFSHVRTRVAAFINPWADMSGTGYQITQSLFAIGTGGWFGLGLFMGAPGYIPEVTQDFIFSAISEELGGIFAIFLILLCLCFTLMFLRIAIRINKIFYKLTALGLACVYSVQVFCTIGGAIKFIPSTGVTLPFISSGGSSLLASMITLGIIQALYVISERDTETERQMIKDGADISEFAGFEHLPENPDYRKSKIREIIFPEDESFYEPDIRLDNLNDDNSADNEVPY